MITIEKVIQQLNINAEIVRTLVEPISEEQANWKPDEETWNMKEVIEHVYNEERIDFRKHLKEMFSEPPLPWGKFRHEELILVESCHQALESFLKERQASLECCVH